LLASLTVVAQDQATAVSPSVSPAATPAQTAATSTTAPELLQFQKIEDAWSNAVNQHDQFALELVLSPLFVDVSANGDITTRNQQLVQVITGEDKVLHLTQRVIAVRMLGEVAVANGSYVLHHHAGSVEVDEKGVFTHVFERQRGGWVCINSQRTLLREDSNTKTKKPSNAESPLHFPLFSR
jgi:ketosteroid isomerase-like protein